MDDMEAITIEYYDAATGEVTQTIETSVAVRPEVRMAARLALLEERMTEAADAADGIDPDLISDQVTRVEVVKLKDALGKLRGAPEGDE
jgi:hypothetical protein